MSEIENAVTEVFPPWETPEHPGVYRVNEINDPSDALRCSNFAYWCEIWFRPAATPEEADEYFMRTERSRAQAYCWRGVAAPIPEAQPEAQPEAAEVVPAGGTTSVEDLFGLPPVAPEDTTKQEDAATEDPNDISDLFNA